ncbi:MAG: BlaB/IND/MUS family subclass B1 metallo-beta-lactamase [Flavisolibacter sp.]
MLRLLTTMVLSLCMVTLAFGQAPAGGLKISPLTGDFYIYTTYHSYKGSMVPANGMYLVTKDGAVILDTPWDTTQFQPLLDSIWARHGKNVVCCISTHFHEDRTAGLEYYSQQGIKTFASRRTDELCKEHYQKRAACIFEKDTVFKVGEYSFQTYFPGQGHTADNIVVWFEKQRILYGGCLVKSMEDDSLGNLADANVKDYPATLEKVQKKCKNPAFIITGHGDWTNTNSLKHTLSMAQQLKRSQSE